MQTDKNGLAEEFEQCKLIVSACRLNPGDIIATGSPADNGRTMGASCSRAT